jgi:hypothetical protein
VTIPYQMVAEFTDSPAASRASVPVASPPTPLPSNSIQSLQQQALAAVNAEVAKVQASMDEALAGAGQVLGLPPAFPFPGK